MELKYTHNSNDYVTDSESLGPDAIAYLLTYGYRQSLQDSIAGREKKVRTEAAEAAAKAGVAVDETAVTKSVSEDLDAALMKRRDAIQAGTIKVGGSRPRDPFASACWDIAEGKVLEAYRKQVGRGPKTSAERDRFETLVQEFLDKHREAIEKEVKRQQAAFTKIADVGELTI